MAGPGAAAVAWPKAGRTVGVGVAFIGLPGGFIRASNGPFLASNLEVGTRSRRVETGQRGPRPSDRADFSAGFLLARASASVVIC